MIESGLKAVSEALTDSIGCVINLSLFADKEIRAQSKKRLNAQDLEKIAKAIRELEAMGETAKLPKYTCDLCGHSWKEGDPFHRFFYGFKIIKTDLLPPTVAYAKLPQDGDRHICDKCRKVVIDGLEG